MRRFSWEQLVDFAAGLEGAVLALWIGLAALSVALFILSRTRWGQERPLRKCLVLSILAHVLLAGYATTVQIVAGRPARAPEPVVHISLDDGNPWEARLPEAGADAPKPWASHHHDSAAEPESLQEERAQVNAAEINERTSRADQFGYVAPPLDQVAMVEPVQPQPDSLPDSKTPATAASAQAAAAVDAPAPERREATPTQIPDASTSRTEVADAPEPPSRTAREGIMASLLEPPMPLPRRAETPVTVEPDQMLPGPTDIQSTPSHEQPTDLAKADAAVPDSVTAPLQPSALTATSISPTRPLPQTAASVIAGLINIPPLDIGGETVGPPVLGNVQRSRPMEDVPRVYRLRVAPNRSEIALRYGATTETEAAVRAGLKWLADNQEPDGRWSPTRHGGGEEHRVLGRDRFGAGAQADTGISALALLAFLASGHTHQEGVYRDNVRRGLEYLLRSQASDGNLGGKAATYAFMYCHAMATFAVSEAYGMTDDRRLEQPVRRAIMYTVTTQNAKTGGWRYKRGDEGDTSQLGWQLMALKSADLAGIPMPAHTRQGALRYLQSVTSGRFGGLAAYRPVESPNQTMTAEALACQYFLDSRPGSLAVGEAADYLLEELPGQSEGNFYYWYYATLGLYQTQGDAWDQWNAAMQRELLARQRNSGPLAGSWDPDTVWGGYGGRVYTTALGTLCLEVYYRFMPLYVEAASVGRRFR